MYLKNPTWIESMSMDIIDQTLAAHSFTDQELEVVRRMIHATGDIDYQQIVFISPGAIDVGIEAIQAGCRIVTDTRMAFAGINKRALTLADCTIECYVDHAEVFQMAKYRKITRSMAAMEVAMRWGADIFVIGNAPTALYRLGELMQESQVSPELIIGVPVGFVGAAEAKEYIRRLKVPSITTVGTKGGSNVAAAIMNALIYMAVGRA
ncbi:MAG: precorrin-8X methylmutase [Candidatus Vecturithrix sp.]|jgi:precorrin-8X/cobalt-precorrin-8 methylmutase|nr:precorrin-8X methylmutase [Candidatus Vecturithrix sp.]